MSRDQVLALQANRSPVAAAPVEIIGEAPALRDAVAMARRFAPSRMPILLLGATGTGKELFAQATHEWSGRPGPLVDINCGALPSKLVEAELFGHQRGAFTGAVTNRRGLITAADRGTLLLDELESLPRSAQVKLLRVLETLQVRAVGTDSTHLVDVRVVAAAQPDLQHRTGTGKFRLDLLFRLMGIVIQLPDLRTRGDDVVLLARVFAAKSGRELGPGVDRVLLSYDWPGNVRELRTTIERAVHLTDAPRLDVVAVREALALGGQGLARVREQNGNGHAAAGREELLDLCVRHEWRIEDIAAAAGVSRATLYRRLKEAGLSPEKCGNGGYGGFVEP